MRIRSVEGSNGIGARVPGVIVVGLLLLVAVGNASAAKFLEGGEDCWITTPPSSAHIDLPPDYFQVCGDRHSLATIQDIPVTGDPTAPPPCACSCAPPVVQWSDAHGNPVQPGKHAVTSTVVRGEADTCVERQPTTLQGVGIQSTADVKIKCLKLKGTIIVPFSPGPDCTYEVKISLTGTQSTGNIEFTPTSADLRTGNVTLGSLPVGVQATFTPTSGCCPPNMPPADLTTTFSNTPGTYTLPIAPSALSDMGIVVLVVGLLLGMTFMMWRRYRRNAEA